MVSTLNLPHWLPLTIRHLPSHSLQVHNFPLMKTDEKALRKIMMLRRVEVVERRMVRQEEMAAAATEEGGGLK